MDFLKRFFAKANTAGLFSVYFPQASAAPTNTEYLKAYKSWVYACTRAIANDVGTIELELQQKSGKGRERVESHPAIDLLSSVNPFNTSDGLFRGTSSYLDLVGNAFWYVAYNGRQEPSELWQLAPTKVTIIKSDKGYIAGWICTNPKGEQVILQPFEEEQRYLRN